jgi:hypothetical protein
VLFGDAEGGALFFMTHGGVVFGFWLCLPIGNRSAAWGESAARETKV